MNILGVSCYYHDAAAALLRDGVPVAAAEEERFSRRKHDSGFPHLAIRFCLETAGIEVGDLDYVVFYEKPLLKFERILQTTLATFPRSSGVFRESMIQWFNEKLWIKSRLIEEFRLPASKVLFSEHHVSHAASAFLCSPYEEAAILTVDGVGEWTTTAIGRGSASWNGPGNNRIELVEELRFPHSIGLLYSAFTAFLGFEVNEGEYKVMGMAPYGEPRFIDDVRKVVQIEDSGAINLDLRYFEYQRSLHSSFTRKFVDLFGPPRRAESEFTVEGNRAVGESKHYADIAASIQTVVEDVLLRLVDYAHTRTGLDNLCLAGGVALNSAANGRIVRESKFKRVYIQPAAGDGGGALGAALYAHHVVLGQPRKHVLETAYLGAGYSEAEAADFFRAGGISYRTFNHADELLTFVADRIANGQVVGWHQGRFEWGPRALGNRSILADPRSETMKHTVNQKIKFREPFRPFAPAVLESRAAEFFDLKDVEENYPLRFMLLVYPWLSAAAAVAPAVNHVGTGRLQTVREEWNPLYYGLIKQFEQNTGVPILLNTSFNLRGEPIVSTPEQAWSSFSRSGLDLLVIGPHVVTK